MPPTGRGKPRVGKTGPARVPPAEQTQSAPRDEASAEFASAALHVTQHDIFSSGDTDSAASAIPGMATPFPLGTTLNRALRGTHAGRFRPRAVRRDAIARDNLAREEAGKDVAKVEADSRERGRNRGRGRRGRGDMMGRGGRKLVEASDPAWNIADALTGRILRHPNKADGSEMDVDKNIRRINADSLYAPAGDEPGAGGDNGYPADGSFLPMGLFRTRHREPEFEISTSAEIAAREAELEGEHAPRRGRPAEAPPAIKRSESGERMEIDPDGKAGVPVEVPPAQDSESRKTEKDLRILAEELGLPSVDRSGDGADPKPMDKEGRLYLFQFPPVLPPLAVANKARAKLGPGRDTPADADAAEDAAAKKPASGPLAPVLASYFSKGGLAGRLNVRRSGRAEVDWGGTLLSMGLATVPNFPTSAVVVDDDEAAGRPEVFGRSVGMGKIMGRFVLAPTWAEEDDWEVTSEELGETDGDRVMTGC